MSRHFALGLAAIAAIGLSLAIAPAANAFGGSSGSHGGSFGGLFHHHHGSSGSYGSNGGSYNSSDCDCNCGSSGEASEGNHEDNDEHHGVSNGDDRVMEAPREGYRDS